MMEIDPQKKPLCIKIWSFLIGDGRFFGESLFLASKFGIFIIGVGNVDWERCLEKLEYESGLENCRSWCDFYSTRKEKVENDASVFG